MNNKLGLATVDWKKEGFPYCTVYVITTEDAWPSKIGISICPIRRVRDLQGSHWKKLEVWGAGWCQTVAEARRLEKKCHELATRQDFWLLGEWFSIKPQQALEAVRALAKKIGVSFNEDYPDGMLGWDFEREALLNAMGGKPAATSTLRKMTKHVMERVA